MGEGCISQTITVKGVQFSCDQETYGLEPPGVILFLSFFFEVGGGIFGTSHFSENLLPLWDIINDRFP